MPDVKRESDQQPATPMDSELAALVDRHSAELQAMKDRPASFDRLVDTVSRQYNELVEFARCARSESAPIDMVLFCPKCAFQHVDRPQPEKGWTNPPHKSHECQSCGYIWRTADVPTNGVRSTATSSKSDSLPKPCDLAGYDP